MAVIINADRLRELITTIFCHASCDAEEAALMAYWSILI